MQRYLVTYRSGKIFREDARTESIPRSKVLTTDELKVMLDEKNTEDFHCVVTNIEEIWYLLKSVQMLNNKLAEALWYEKNKRCKPSGKARW